MARWSAGRAAPWDSGLLASLALIHDAVPGGLEVSSQCKDSLLSFATCQARSALFSVCANKDLLNSTGMQQVLGCAKVPDPAMRLQKCQQMCLRDAGVLVKDDNLTKPCPASIQAMHAFNQNLDIFTIGTANPEVNFSQAIFVPFPNVKSMLGPATMQLGSPEKCAQVPSAQYCILSGMVMLNGGSPNRPFTFSSGNCLPRACAEAELQAAVNGLAGNATQRLFPHVQCGFVRALGNATGPSKELESFLGWGGVPVEHTSNFSVTPGLVVAACLCGVILAMVAAGTALDLRREAWQQKQQERQLGGLGEMEEPLSAEPVALQRSPPETFLNHWSLVRNCASLMRIRPPAENQFACLDAIRVISMVQVILGHTFFYPVVSSGLSNMEQFAPPNGLMGQAWFMLIPGCFYGVDSFFLLSGFLCANGLEKKVFSKPQFKKPVGFSLMYLKFIVMRYFRLIPLAMFVTLLMTTVLPSMGTGVLWEMDRPSGDRCYDSAGGGGCEKYWWTILLFIQNADAYLAKCMGHLWYLAADLQIYLTAPFFSLVYALNHKAGWSLLGLGLLVGVALPMILMHQHQWVPDTLLGGNTFSTKVYMKPWCRLSPFIIGIGLAWIWSSRFERIRSARFERNRGLCVTPRGRLQSLVLSLLGIGLCCAATFGRLAMYTDDMSVVADINRNPAGKVFMYLWAGFSIPVWAIGMSIIIHLCIQDRFLPLLQPFLCQPFWQPIAKLTYAAYLIHTAVLILNFCQRDQEYFYAGSIYFFAVIAFIVVSMALAAVLHVLVEKPLANLQMKLLGGGGD
jgi:peptidoglycan/LPS O-acetylase OafA/YrhL